MAQETPVTDPYQEYFASISVKLRDLEEKQNIIRERVVLIGENFLDEKQESEEEKENLKKRLEKSEKEVANLKSVIQRLVDSQKNYARKTELSILKKQYEMFKPLNIARIKDVKEIVKQEISKKR